jgi:hypothetical protein
MDEANWPIITHSFRLLFLREEDNISRVEEVEGLTPQLGKLHDRCNHFSFDNFLAFGVESLDEAIGTRGVLFRHRSNNPFDFFLRNRY